MEAHVKGLCLLVFLFLDTLLEFSLFIEQLRCEGFFPSSFSAFSKRSTVPQPWVLAHSAISVSPSSKVMFGLKFSSFCALLMSA